MRKSLLSQRLIPVVLLFCLLPWILLGAAGLNWLLSNQWIFPWLGLVIITSLVSWLAARRFSSKAMKPPVPQSLRAEASDNWSARQRQAWQAVESICERIEQEKPALDDWPSHLALFRETVETVAAHFHPDRDSAFLEMRVPDLLQIIELLSHDLRVLCSEHVPGSHIVTINDVVKGRQVVDRLKKIYNWYRLVAFALSPVTAVVNEIRGMVNADTVSLVYQEMKRYVTLACVRKVGLYSIRLYSGELEFSSGDLESYVSKETKQDQRRMEQREREFASEPLRIAVVGQSKSGKSSLINHLFGELQAVVDAVPTTVGVQPYILAREILPQAIIIDTGGYEVASSVEESEAVEKAMDSADLIILVCSSVNPSRNADKILLETMRERFRKRNREMPAFLIALSHIDRLRPYRDWSPPYCLDPAEGPKAASILAAMESTAQDFAISIDQIVPLNLDDGYNVEESLIPNILRQLPEARRHQYLRCLKAFHDEKYWERLWKQSCNAGRLLVRSGGKWLKTKWIDE